MPQGFSEDIIHQGTPSGMPPSFLEELQGLESDSRRQQLQYDTSGANTNTLFYPNALCMEYLYNSYTY